MYPQIGTSSCPPLPSSGFRRRASSPPSSVLRASKTPPRPSRRSSVSLDRAVPPTGGDVEVSHVRGESLCAHSTHRDHSFHVIVIGAKRREDVSVVDQPPSVKGVIVAVLHLFFVLCFLLSKKRRLWAVWAARSVRRPTSLWETRSWRFP